RFVRIGIAHRTNPRPQLSGDRPGPGVDFIVIAYARPGRMRWNGRGKAGVWASPAARFDTERKTVHPTQKPLALMRALVADFSEPDELVLEPFAGSGTTALACLELGRRFVGWERDANYYEVARSRIDRVAVGAVAAAVDRPTPRQIDLFGDVEKYPSATQTG